MLGQEYSENVDVWSAGVVLYECFTGSNPFMSKYKKDTDKNIIKLPIKELITDEIKAEKDFLNLLMKCLERDPQKRISSSKAYNHKWLKVNFYFYYNNF